jgi:hypothetical protein
LRKVIALIEPSCLFVCGVNDEQRRRDVGICLNDLSDYIGQQHLAQAPLWIVLVLPIDR